MQPRTPASFNPHRPRKAGATRLSLLRLLTFCVSILTGPERPVQPSRVAGVLAALDVSILTGPERPVQPYRLLLPKPAQSLFQSSPAPKGRCNVGNITSFASGSSFNPHRPRKAGATIVCVAIYDIPLFVSILTGPERPVQQDIALVGGRCTIGFNPHRPRKAGATDPATRYGYIYRVSILTGPERPVQQCISLLI